MPRRRIGQEALFEDAPKRTPLDEIVELIDWKQIEARLDPENGGAKLDHGSAAVLAVRAA